MSLRDCLMRQQPWTFHVNNAAQLFGFVISLLVFLCCLVLLVTGSPLLLTTLNEGLGLPLGTVSTWLGMMALVLMTWFASPRLRTAASRRDQIYRAALIVLFLLALSWPFVSYGLAGNWSFSFRGQEAFRGSSRAADWFFRFTYGVVLLAALFPVVRFIHSRLAR